MSYITTNRIAAGLVFFAALASSSGYAATAAPAAPVVQLPCQSSWYQCMKQDQLNPKPGYVSKVVDQYLDSVGGKIAISLEDFFQQKGKKTNEDVCREALNRVYNLMTTPTEQKDDAVRNYFTGQRLCPTEMPNRNYPWMLFKSETATGEKKK